MSPSVNSSEENIHKLYNNVPGGIFRCLYDEALTLLEISDGFLDMIGYTREEVHDELQSSLRRLIYPDDLENILEEVERQLARGNIKEIQYRLVHKDGHLITVLDKGTFVKNEQEVPYFCCIVLDITRKIELEEELHLMLDRYRIIIEQTNDVIFEMDLKKDTFLVTGNWDDKFPPCTITGKDSFSVLLNDPLNCPFHPDDLPAFKNCIRQLSDCQVYVHEKLRIKNRDGRYNWFHLRMTQQFDQNRHPYRIIGVIVDIDKEMNKSQLLLKRAEQDPMTGLYNKVTVQSQIRSYLQQDTEQSTGALLIIDIDDFKGINDTQGHLFGDTVLSNLARNMQKSFRGTDILGRIGGDEFLIFLKSVGSVENTCQNAEKMLRLFHSMNASQDNFPLISGSIGIAMYPEDGQDYTTLFKKADAALYQAKHSGKNQYAFFNQKHQPETDFVKGLSAQTGRTMLHAQSASSSAEVVEYAFHLLYNSPYFDKTLLSVLELVGGFYQLGHIYIYECKQSPDHFQLSYDWYNSKETSAGHSIEEFSLEADLENNYQANFDEHNVFLCTAPALLSEKQQALFASRSPDGFIQYAIREHCRLQGLIGFEALGGEAFCARVHLDSLVLIAELLTLFLQKNRT